MNKKEMRSLGAIIVVFLIIALSAVDLIFSPALIHTASPDYGEVIAAAPATTIPGLLLRVDTWKTYPDYNIGLGFIALIAFTGAVYTARVMYAIKEAENEGSVGRC